MDPDGNLTPVWLAAQLFARVLFVVAFGFLWLRSRIVYFGLWAMAWMAQLFALGFAYLYVEGNEHFWLAPIAFFEFTFTVFLVAAAQAGLSGSTRNWRSPLILVAGFPLLLAAVVAGGGPGRPRVFFGLQLLVLTAVFTYNWARIHAPGAGGRVLRGSLLAFAVLYAVVAAVLWSGQGFPTVVVWNSVQLADLLLGLLISLSALAMWIDQQRDHARGLLDEVDHLRRESLRNMDLDRLTGLLNQSALARRVENPEGFDGVIVVCDMDNFKEVNDRYGHLVGDEILRNVGNLLRSSIRHEDEAFRWGGDEFVILFHNQDPALARSRMEAVESRLKAFQVRGHGVLPISFSWGIAESKNRPLREVLDAADRKMYDLKRSRAKPPV